MIRKCILALIVLLTMALDLHVSAQQIILPADLIFTAAINDGGLQPTSLMLLVRVDAKTLVMTPFYIDERATETNLRVLKWSPDGRLLAFYRHVKMDPNDPTIRGYKGQICILTRTGVLSTCMEAEPSVHMVSVMNERNEIQIATLAWSSDGQRLYYVSKSASGARVIEADVKTGRTLRIIYEYPNPNEAFTGMPLISWIPNFTRILVNVGGNSVPLENRLQVLINQDTSERLQLPVQVDSATGQVEYCLQLSPKGTYSTAITQAHDGLMVIDSQGQVVHRLDHESGYGDLRLTCPTWESDESGFYVIASVANRAAEVFRYSMADKKLTVIYSPQQIESASGAVGDYLALSPNGDTLAVNGIDNRTQIVPYQVRVIFPDGQSCAFLGEYYYTMDPIWIPPAQ